MKSLQTEELKPLELPRLPDNPSVSVLIANYNYAQYIGTAIESVLCQTYPHFEVIICDDGSTDNSREVIEQYASRDSRVKFVFKENGGVASALNAAYLHSKGEIICLLDADDYFTPEKLEKVTCELIAHPESGTLVHPLMRVDAKGRYLGRYPLTKPVSRGWLALHAANTGSAMIWFPTTSGLSIRREVFDYIYPINEKFRSHVDGIIHRIVVYLTPITAIDEILAYYRLHTSNITYYSGNSSIHGYLEKRKKDFEITRQIHDYIDSWLRNYCPGMQLFPYENTWGYIESQYLITRLAGEPRAVQMSWFRKLISHPRTQALFLYNLYHRLAWWLPLGVFKSSLNIVYGQNWLKTLLYFFKMKTLARQQ